MRCLSQQDVDRAEQDRLYRDAIIEVCARVAETVHGRDEGDIVQHVFAGHRIAKEIRRLKRTLAFRQGEHS